MSRWFRHYAGMMRDEKLVSVAIKAKQPVERVVWLWGVILESAAEINDGGKYEIDHDEIAYFLRADSADVAAIENALGSLGRVREGVVAKWGDRQFQSDRSAERQRRYRDSHKTPSDDEVRKPKPSRDGQVTSPSRQRDAPYTETELDTEKKEVEAVAIAPPQPKARGTRLPDDWKPSLDDVAFATGRGLSAEAIRDEVLKFRNYWTAKPGKDGTKLDWSRTWQNWILNSNRGPSNGKPENSVMAAIRAVNTGPSPFDREPTRGLCSEAGGTALRLLPEGGRERSLDLRPGRDRDAG